MKQSSRLPGILIAGMLVSNCSAYSARVEAKNPTQVTVAKSHSQSASMATAQPQVEVPSQAAPTFRLFGLPFHLWAPIERPYEPSAYRDLAGQPEAGDGAVLVQGMNGS